jgi:hypothetical protein
MKIKKSELLALIKEEIMSEMDGLTMMDDPYDDDDMDMKQEGMENITPENIEIVGQAMAQMAPLIGVMSLPILIGMIYEKLKEMGAK